MMKEPKDGDKNHQDTARTNKKDPGARPKTSSKGGSCIQSQPGPSTKISSQISSVIDSSEDELSSTSEVMSVPRPSSVRDDGGATSVSITESKTSSTQSDRDWGHSDESGTSGSKKKKKQSRGARGGKNKKKNENLLPPSPLPPPPEIIDEVDSTASELDQMQLKDDAVVEEQIGAMAPEGSMPNILQRMVQGGRMQERTNIAIYVDKMTINQPCGNTDSSSLVPVPTIVPVKLRRKLAVLMNKESPVGKDWKGLADELGLGEYIISLEDCKNPTAELIKLAESERKIQNLEDLTKAFQRMKREDCADLCRNVERTCPPEPTLDDNDSDSF